MSIEAHDGCRSTHESGAFCDGDRDHPGPVHQAVTSTGWVTWTEHRPRGADVTPPLRNAQPTVPDVRA